MRPVSRFTFHASQRGVALVVTLLLLSIITFMTITFLVVSRSQKGSVVTETDQAIARLAADTALERAKAELLAGIMGSTNEFNYGLLVSTNYINSAGFISGNTSPFNVNYDYLVSGSTNFAIQDREQNIANLLYNPRPPVFVNTNRYQTTPPEFRFYLDLNRNGFYDPNGLQPVIETNGQRIIQNGIIVSNFFVGDPDWIGSLERPEITHSADNKFVNRYAYIAIPAGNTLDINFMHNQAGNPAKAVLNPTGTDFVRDQGVGTWEINLAAFLCDLNPNPGPWGSWSDYTYGLVNGSLSAGGTAFLDAGSLLGYRYGYPNGRLASVSALFSNGQSVFRNDGIDGYTTSLLINSPGFPQDPDISLTGYPWSGADNPNHFFTTQELFNESETAPFTTSANLPSTPTFTKRLLAFGTNNDSYNRNTFYRLLSQLGTDSAPEPAGKMNLNYRNVDNYGNVVPGMATNFIPWDPVVFFTNAAIRLLANAGYTAGVGPTNLLQVSYVNGVWVTNLYIQLWPTNFYTPSVQRLLQLAANIYDASTNRTFGLATATNGLPSVFQPVFGYIKTRDRVSITGYQEVTNASVLLNQPVLDLTLLSHRLKLKPAPEINDQMVFWGVPLVIGAKKGLPNFNKFALQTQVQVTRKLQFHRPGTSNTDPVNELDQMFVVGITNSLGVEAWNSYATTFPRSLRMVVIPTLNTAITNLETHTLVNSTAWTPPVIATNIPATAWSGYNPGREGPSFILPITSGPGVPYTNQVVLPASTYRASSQTFTQLTGIFQRTVGTTNVHVPHWQLNLRTRLRFALVDTSLSPNRIVDYVNLDSATDPLGANSLDITTNLFSDANCGTFQTPSGNNGSMWCTNTTSGSPANSVTFGIMNQIAASMGQVTADWTASLNEAPAGMSKGQAAIPFFQAQFEPPGANLYQTNTFAAPYQPFRNLYLVTEWEANDPLVHYTVADLRNLQQTNVVLGVPNNRNPNLALLGHINGRYEPWGGNPKKTGVGVGVNAPTYALTVKDPVAATQGRSDYWDFPTNKFPNVGWLGRVHRGTPWQTVYLKSPTLDIPTWQRWTGNGLWVTNYGQLSTNLLALHVSGAYYNYGGKRVEIGTAPEAYLSMPTNDWHILDLFTTALNDNATHGQLSINQSGLAAWSAVLSGVVVLTNALDADGNVLLSPQVIQPAGVYDAFASSPATWPPLARIVNGINRTRANTNVAFPVFQSRSFQSLGDILAVPELTVGSPFLNTNTLPADLNYPNDALTDAVVERIPQQILGLLKCDHTPRFVVYSFGQALKPADRSLVTSGAFSRLCTNYQVMAEAATRAVIRVDGAPTNAHIVIESFNILPPD